MADLTKVIKGLECCNYPNDHENCPYNGAEHYNTCTHNLLNDAAELLEKQSKKIADLKRERKELRMELETLDPVKPLVAGRGESFETAETWWYECDNCRGALSLDDKYCRKCGRAVKWDD